MAPGDDMDRTLSAILRPRSIAVVGASRHETSIGREILHNLIEYGFSGPIYPVNPNASSIHSIKCYPTLRDIPDPVDLAVVVVPKEFVPRVVDDAIASKVQGLVVITAGFKEVGGQGETAEHAIRDRIRAAGIRMVGPNCMGVINTDPEVRMNATFAATRPEPGSAGFMSQSGALGEVILSHAHEIGLGIAYFVSMGNKADISGNDLVEAWEGDRRVNVILMYLESFGNPTRFLSIARRVTRTKPILAVKSGRTAAGARAAFSHTGALAAASVAYDTLLDQAGVIRVESLSEMFTLAAAFAHERLPEGPRVGILTNAGGPAIMATDACVTLGLEVIELPADTQSKLRRVLVPEASTRNPVDMVAAADGSSYAKALDILKDEPGLDGLIVIFVSPIMINAVEVARSIIAAARNARRPILTCFMGQEQGKQGVEELRAAGIPVYMFPEEAARAMAGLDRYRRIRSRPEGRTRSFDVDRPRAAAVLSAAASAGRRVLLPEETEQLLVAYGLPMAPSKIAADEKEAVAAAVQVGYPVVLKGIAEDLVHKTEAGAVFLDLRSAAEVEQACRTMREAFDRAARDEPLRQPALRYQVQKMVRGGRETILGIARDPKLGAILMFGLGGIFVEVMKDVVFRILPITDVEAEEMVRGIRGHALLAGARGGPPVDEAFLVEGLLRLGQMAAEHPEIEQVDINPLLAGPDRASSFVVDARVRLAPAAR